MRDRLSLSRYCGMAFLPQKRTSSSDGLDGERKCTFNFEIKLRSVEEEEAFKRRLSNVCDFLPTNFLSSGMKSGVSIFLCSTVICDLFM